MQSPEVIACSKVITMHTLNSKQAVHAYTPHKGMINCVHINHTNKVVASSGQDGRIVLVNAQKPDNEVFETKFHESSLKPISVSAVMFSPNSFYIAAGASDSQVKIWDMKNHKSVFSTIKAHVAPITSLAWIKQMGVEKSNDILASASSIGDIFLHSVKNSNVVETFNASRQESINQIKVLESESYSRLTACTTNGSIMVWDLKNSHKDKSPFCEFSNGKKSSVTSVSFSSFNPVLLAASSIDEKMTFYDINEKKAVKVISTEEPLTSINFHSDGHTLVAGGMYGGLFVYDLRKPNKIKERLVGHDTAIKHTEFIKEYEPSSSMGASRASRASHASSTLSNATQSKASTTSKSRQKDGIQSRQALKNNFMAVNAQETSSEYSKSKARNSAQIPSNNPPKLSSTGQEALKNATYQQQSTKPMNPSSQVSNTSSTYQPYNNPVKKNQSISGTSLNNGIAEQKGGAGIGEFKSTSYNNINMGQSGGLGSQGAQYHYQQRANSGNNELKEFIDDKIENLHMEIIHQFHEQHMELKKMIGELVLDSREKDAEIQQLKQEIHKLRNRSY